MNGAESIVVTSMGIEVPGLCTPEQMLTLDRLLPPGEFDPVARLGRKGLLNKDRATRLALCSVQAALDRGGLIDMGPEEAAATGVVVSSNLGNADTVCRVTDTIHGGSVDELSPLDTPNASSNVIASTIAIRYGLQAVNLMLCSGATAGLDALYLAAAAIAAGRARRMVVVGVEPRNAVVTQLLTTSKHAVPPGEGAACLVLEAESSAARRGAQVLGRIGRYKYASPRQDPAITVRQALGPEGAQPSVWLTPSLAWPETRHLIDRMTGEWESTPRLLDLSQGLGDLYGATGVFQGVAACVWLQQDRSDVLTTVGSSWGDGTASLLLTHSEHQGGWGL